MICHAIVLLGSAKWRQQEGFVGVSPSMAVGLVVQRSSVGWKVDMAIKDNLYGGIID